MNNIQEILNQIQTGKWSKWKDDVLTNKSKSKLIYVFKKGKFIDSVMTIQELKQKYGHRSHVLLMNGCESSDGLFISRTKIYSPKKKFMKHKSRSRKTLFFKENELVLESDSMIEGCLKLKFDKNSVFKAMRENRTYKGYTIKYFDGI